jgi:hypothetical protein
MTDPKPLAHNPFAPKPKLPSVHPLRSTAFGDADGAVITHAGRYAREAVLVAFEMIGGVERMADWANQNPGEFYTKLYTKVITREVEVSASEGIEDLLLRLDRAGRSETLLGVAEDDEDEHVVDAEIVE